jgi:hypothetical protein
LPTQVQKYVLGADDQCAVTVLPAASALATHLIRVLPYVHSDRDHLVCFFGYLSNLSELASRVSGLGHSPGHHHAEAHADTGATTTSLILRLYQKSHGEKREELMLSELQVCAWACGLSKQCGANAGSGKTKEPSLFTVHAL